jgi:hypothetical protein
MSRTRHGQRDRRTYLFIDFLSPPYSLQSITGNEVLFTGSC